VGFDGTDYEIYTINANGGGERQITDNSTRDRYPYYSPNGKKIAYSGFDGTDSEIYTINVGGGASSTSPTTPRRTTTPTTLPTASG